MKRSFVQLLIILLIQSCSDNHNLINSNNIKSIVITLDSEQRNIALSKIEITNRDSLMRIIAKLNECDKEPIKFYPTQWLKLTYDDGQEKTIVCNGSSMKYNGLTYKLKETIRDITGH
jgi:hypothetical protein